MVAQDNLLGVVDPEEVRVQNSLNNSGDNRNWVRVGFGKVSIDPVRDI